MEINAELDALVDFCDRYEIQPEDLDDIVSDVTAKADFPDIDETPGSHQVEPVTIEPAQRANLIEADGIPEQIIYLYEHLGFAETFRQLEELT